MGHEHRQLLCAGRAQAIRDRAGLDSQRIDTDTCGVSFAIDTQGPTRPVLRTDRRPVFAALGVCLSDLVHGFHGESTPQANTSFLVHKQAIALAPNGLAQASNLWQHAPSCAWPSSLQANFDAAAGPCPVH